MEDDKPTRQQINLIITRIIQDLGVPANIRGYGYLREAILRAFYNPEVIHSMIKTLYPEVAQSFNTTPEKVLRGIRHAVDLAWNCGNMEAMSLDMGSPIYKLKYKPTSTQIIAMIVDWMQLHTGSEQTLIEPPGE